MNEKNFCIAPFIQIVTDTRQGGGPCPYNSQCWTFKEKTLIEKWNSKEAVSLRQQFINGEKPQTCNRCWNDEKAGKKSLRQRLYNFSTGSPDAHTTNIRDPKKVFEKVYKKFIEKNEYNNGPQVLTIKPGNLCNLGCRSCNPSDSSQWVSMLNRLQKENKLSFIENQKNSDLSDEQINDIVSYSKNLKRLEIFGGEPFYHKSVKDKLLPKLIDVGSSKDIVLYFNTNGTIYDDKIKQLANNFKKLEVRISIDGINEQFEYLRYPAKYSEVIENGKKLYDLAKGNFEIVCTISPYNFLYLDEYDSAFKKLGWNVFYNLTVGPDYMLLYNIPNEVKHNITLSEKFKDIEIYIKNTKSDPVAWKRFIKMTKILDKDRNQNFATVFPEFYKLIQHTI